MYSLRTVTRMPSVSAVDVSVAAICPSLAYRPRSRSRRTRRPAAASCDSAARHHRNVVGQPVKRRGAISEGVTAVEVEPPESRAGKDVVEVHAHSHETCRGPQDELLEGHRVALGESVNPSLFFDQKLVDR